MDKIPRQRNSSQEKEQEMVMASDLIKTDISNIPDGEFKAIVIRILAGLEKCMEDIRESLTAEIKELKNNQAEVKDALTEIGNKLDVMVTNMEEA